MVAVVIPCHNRSDLTRMTLENVLRAEGVDFQVFAVDDASSDDTPALMSSFKDSRLQCHRFDNSIGASAARNFGFEQSDSEFVCFLDSDDLIHPEKLAHQVDILKQNPGADLAVCQMAHFEHDPKEAEFLWNTFQGDEPRRRFISHDPVWGIHAPLWRRSTLDRVAASRPNGGVLDASLPVAQDFELHGRALLLGAKPLLHNDLLAFCRQHQAVSIGSDKGKVRFHTLERVFADFAGLTDNPAERELLIGNTWWLAVRSVLIQDSALCQSSLAKLPRAWKFRLLCRLALRLRRHRFYLLARKEAKRNGHDLAIRDEWFQAHRIEAEPGLTRFTMPH